MFYLNTKDLERIGIDWDDSINAIEAAVRELNRNDFVQPIKPYLRYRDLKNRIIAMPAFIGGDFNIAGIKWIASFPRNLQKGIPRAHSVTILNHADTGEPVAIFNSNLLSVIRTASVTGLVIRQFNQVRPQNKISLGIIGWGPVGQHHLKMCLDILKDKISTIYLYDINKIPEYPGELDKKYRIKIVKNWEEAYTNSDIFITCTVSNGPYIDKKPKPGSLHLNVSLRDYKQDTYEYFKDAVIVDDWEEVCREKTDIEIMHLEKNLVKENTKSIIDVVCYNCLRDYPASQPVFFNPMGMAVFDIAMGKYYLNKAEECRIGLALE
jgi:2,3-diaminopropionate biosynthesis protein SbnB